MSEKIVNILDSVVTRPELIKKHREQLARIMKKEVNEKFWTERKDLSWNDKVWDLMKVLRVRV